MEAESWYRSLVRRKEEVSVEDENETKKKNSSFDKNLTTLDVSVSLSSIDSDSQYLDANYNSEAEDYGKRN